MSEEFREQELNLIQQHKHVLVICNTKMQFYFKYFNFEVEIYKKLINRLHQNRHHQMIQQKVMKAVKEVMASMA